MISPTLELVSLYRFDNILRSQLRSLWPAVIILIFLLTTFFLMSASILLTKAAPRPIYSVPANTSSLPGAPASAATPGPPQAGGLQAAVPQNCEQNTTYNKPAPLNLVSQPNGLTQVIDAPTYYQVFGYTSAQIRTQIQQCAPDATNSDAKFGAETSYNLTWKYDSTPDGTGKCSVSNAKVGLHVNTILPTWQPTGAAGNGLTDIWQKFISSLASHEDGHTAIDQQYANWVLNDLQSFPATECSSIAASIQSKVNADFAALGAANDAYDLRTNHGVTQGAMLR